MAIRSNTQAAEELRAIFPVDSEVRVRIEYVSRSGMTRDIVVYGPDGQNVSALVAEVLAGRLSPRGDVGPAVRVGGAGMDMGFHLVYSLAGALYRGVYDGNAGYALRHRWVD